MIYEPLEPNWNGIIPDWQALFARGLQRAVIAAVNTVGGNTESDYTETTADKTKKWFMSHFPLLGALAVAFNVKEDANLCMRLGISVAAVDAQAGEILFNPAGFSKDWQGNLDEEEYRFVMAHELLHVALRHHARRQGRDPFFWNVACDYVINGWLVEMDVGQMPRLGILYDSQLKGLSAEVIYDRIVGDLRLLRKRKTVRNRLYRKYRTFAGVGSCDIIDGSIADWWTIGEGLTLDDFYRRALAQGFNYQVVET
ncbi:MAG: hypothetical protein AAFQ07_06660 [Chloroflexota bacterium]